MILRGSEALLKIRRPALCHWMVILENQLTQLPYLRREGAVKQVDGTRKQGLSDWRLDEFHLSPVAALRFPLYSPEVDGLTKRGLAGTHASWPGTHSPLPGVRCHERHCLVEYQGSRPRSKRDLSALTRNGRRGKSLNPPPPHSIQSRLHSFGLDSFRSPHGSL